MPTLKLRGSKTPRISPGVEPRFSGTFTSGDLIDAFQIDTWIPEYQRRRVPSKAKINSIINTYKERVEIPAIYLNVKGTATCRTDGTVDLKGDISVIDGRQRLEALVDSGVRDYPMLAVVCMNKSLKDQVTLFHALNDQVTSLSFGELAKSYMTAGGDLVRKIINSKVFPYKIGPIGSKDTMSLSLVAPMMFWAHKRLNEGVTVANLKSQPKPLFQSPERTAEEMDMVEEALRSVLDLFRDLFGTYAGGALAYRRAFFLSLCHILVFSFMDDGGRINLGKFAKKFKSIQNKFLCRADIRELLQGGSADDNMRRMRKELEVFLNHKMKGDKIVTLDELTEQEEPDESEEEEAKVSPTETGSSDLELTT